MFFSFNSKAREHLDIRVGKGISVTVVFVFSRDDDFFSPAVTFSR